MHRYVAMDCMAWHVQCYCCCSVSVYLQVIAVVLALASNSFGECLGTSEVRVNDIGN